MDCVEHRYTAALTRYMDSPVRPSLAVQAEGHRSRFRFAHMLEDSVWTSRVSSGGSCVQP